MKEESRKKKLKPIIIIIIMGLWSFGIYFIISFDKPVIIKPFPNPFIFNNGTQVSTQEDWLIRREEIKELLIDVEYGHMPERPDALNASEISSEVRADGSIAKVVELLIIPSNSTPNLKIPFTLWIYIPSGTGPFPAIVKVSPDGKGSQAEMNQEIVTRGYIYVCFENEELDPDIQGGDEVGPCQATYPSYDWGSVLVWAWGAMRVVDYLLGEIWVSAPNGIPDVDPDKLIITGHSRRGKAALLAGALDERFAMVVPNGSGCGGAGSFLVQGTFCETLGIITSDFTYKAWFQKDFNQYGGREIDLPFDQHFLRALVAPRLVLSTDGVGDLWANPLGTQAVYEAVIPVYEFLGARNNNAIHFRGGFHAFSEEDFNVLLDFADKMLLGKDITGEFYMTPFKFEAPIEYSAPS